MDIKPFNSEVYVCSSPGCNHIWRTSAKRPRCAKCNGENPRAATTEEKREFNKRYKKDTATQEPAGIIQQITQAVNPPAAEPPAAQPAAQEQPITAPIINMPALPGAANNTDFLIPANIKPEIKQVTTEQIINSDKAITASTPQQPAEQPKKGFKIASKTVFMFAGMAGIAAAFIVLIKRKKQREIEAAYLNYEQDLEQQAEPEETIFNPAGFA